MADGDLFADEIDLERPFLGQPHGDSSRTVEHQVIAVGVVGRFKAGQTTADREHACQVPAPATVGKAMLVLPRSSAT